MKSMLVLVTLLPEYIGEPPEGWLSSPPLKTLLLAWRQRDLMLLWVFVMARILSRFVWLRRA